MICLFFWKGQHHCMENVIMTRVENWSYFYYELTTQYYCMKINQFNFNTVIYVKKYQRFNYENVYHSNYILIKYLLKNMCMCLKLEKKSNWITSFPKPLLSSEPRIINKRICNAIGKCGSDSKWFLIKFKTT